MKHGLGWIQKLYYQIIIIKQFLYFHFLKTLPLRKIPLLLDTSNSSSWLNFKYFIKYYSSFKEPAKSAFSLSKKLTLQRESKIGKLITFSLGLHRIQSLATGKEMYRPDIEKIRKENSGRMGWISEIF